MGDTGIFITVIIPVLNEADNIKPLHGELAAVLNGLGKPYEILYVDDGSTDGSHDLLTSLHEADPDHVVMLRLRRCFGKAAALTAAFREARGQLIVTCDADGQDGPENIPNMVARLEQGDDLVCGWRRHRRDSAFKRLNSWLYNFAARVLTGVRLHDINCGLKIFRREVVDDLELTGDLHRIVPLMAAWRGFSVAEIKVQHHKRLAGRTKYGIGKLPRGFLDLVMFAVLSRYSRKPGHFLGCTGLAVFMAGFAILLYFLVVKLTGGDVYPRYPLFVLGVLLLIVGLQMVLTGLLAEMVIYHQSAKAEYSIAERLRKD